ncbi:uncharacterized protein LDX57_001116 [Aspergillus melleus]|uniref:uncharacterized protein n=1 Tax=Aspergillus melleus TaxID=138277 RepID=UPI001E8E00BE|nr:uncharacterized protein LDX57_001116 [Aspergillus melleus]KAH8423358.1 hypothetical protein LDX57_001116 [Aspergillus melleus]
MFDLWPVTTVNGFQGPVMEEYSYGLLVVNPASRARSDAFTEMSMELPEHGTVVVVTERRRKQGSTTVSTAVGRWIGTVIDSPKFLYEAKIPQNLVCIRVKRPDRLPSTGHVLQLTGCVNVELDSRGFVRTSNAIWYAMECNKDLDIPSNSPLKRILLAHDNETIALHPSHGHLSAPSAASYVQFVEKYVNPEQLDAIKSALCEGSGRPEI